MAWSNKSDNSDFCKYTLGVPNLDNMLDEAIDWIRHNREPNDVFDVLQLEDWAKENGFVHEDEIKQ